MKKSCEFCGGTGQVSYFKGVSRFLLSSEECPECSGFGYIVSEDDSRPEGKKNKRKETCSGHSKKKKE